MSLNKSFMIVDDSPTMRKLIQMTLKKMGCTSIVDAPSGRIALEKLQASLPDVILTDLEMPEMDGLDFIVQVRGKYALVPIIILSGHGDEATRDKGLLLGATDFLTKPLSGIKLENVLEKIFPGLEF